MQRERVADDIYIFTSELYAQVTAGAILTAEGAVLVDTLLFPEETRQIKQFVEGRLGCPVRYVINTHYHADHTYGTYLFPDALVVAHARCYDLLDTRGREGLALAKASTPDFAHTEIALPGYVFNSGAITMHIGGKTLHLWHSPGHSPDCITCLVKEDRILFAADTLMAIPYFVDGDYWALIESLRAIQHNSFENIIQGHGEIVLRGEVEDKIQGDLNYLAALKKHVESARAKNDPEKYLDRIELERCGKSRILLNGSAQQLHKANVYWLYRALAKQVAQTS